MKEWEKIPPVADVRYWDETQWSQCMLCRWYTWFLSVARAPEPP